MGIMSLAAAAENTAGMVVTSSMFDGLKSAIVSNAEVLIPVGVSVMAIMVGISLIPRILYKFV